MENKAIMERKNAWEKYPQGEKKDALMAFAEEYRKFISVCKTERECTTYIYDLAKEAGFVDLDEAIAAGIALKAGDKVMANNMGKGLAMFILGEKSLEAGMNILGAHVDSPRIDLKQNPLYENTELAYLDTHYYGGIKKYQWLTTPMAIHGVVVRKDGSVENIVIGEDDGDPILMFTDILPHLGADQMSGTAAKIIEGEKLDILIGNKPAKDVEKDAVKETIIAILKEKYNIEEDDFISAELEIVPAGAARDYGLDRSMVIGYGHDDRVCAYTSLKAVLDAKVSEYTSCCILVDKEEIGSVGATGAQSKFFENVIAELINLTTDYSELKVRHALENSKMLSSDVSAGFDPLFPGVNESKNTAYLGNGICFNKYTGSRGKSGSNDAMPEYFAEIRNLLDTADVYYQTSELGKVDQGGGGTIAYILANYGMEVIDSGVPVLNMHAPWEIVSKADVYEAYRAYRAFLLEA